MAELKPGEPFGMDAVKIAKIDWELALKRIIHDLRTDFIYAPHIGYIYRKAGKELITKTKSDLKSGQYSPGLPITIEVPKSFRIQVKAKLNRLGPNFSRPGSILLPRDRLLYQALSDRAAPIIDTNTNHQRSFSHRLASHDSPGMFLPTRTCWNALQKSLTKHSKSTSVKYVLKIDVANFFGSINLHTLINLLNDSGYDTSFSKRLEAVLINYTCERSSRGIIQGVYPSDLFGNYYLTPVDNFFEEYEVPSARYVDDIYVLVDSVDSADQLMRQLIPLLRSYDLTLNEVKSMIMLKSSLKTEEPDLEELFNAAVDEIAQQINESDFDADYGFQSSWDDDSSDSDEDLELQATTMLFDSLPEYPGQEENIERFCLPIFSLAGSDHAVSHVLQSFRKRPSMSQIYSSYLAKFLNDEDVTTGLIDMLEDKSLFDWQIKWVLAALSQSEEPVGESVKFAFALLKDANRHVALRAVAAIYVGTFGDHSRRKSLISIYPSVPPYVQTAIYFSSRRWPSIERHNAKASWGSHGDLNTLLTIAIGKS